jgi:hypothetical protein
MPMRMGSFNAIPSLWPDAEAPLGRWIARPFTPAHCPRDPTGSTKATVEAIGIVRDVSYPFPNAR